MLQGGVFCKCGAGRNLGYLGLQATGHPGVFEVNAVHGKTVMTGKEVVPARQLLENSGPGSHHALLTRALLEQAGAARFAPPPFPGKQNPL